MVIYFIVYILVAPANIRYEEKFDYSLARL